MDENNSDLILEEIKAAMDQIAEKHFISSWAVTAAVRNEKETHSLSTFDGSYPEVIGLIEEFKHRLLTGQADD